MTVIGPALLLLWIVLAASSLLFVLTAVRTSSRFEEGAPGPRSVG